MFLSAEELEHLTGRKRPKAQCEFLAREGYRFRTNSLGEPVVLNDEVRRRFGLSESSAPPPQSPGPAANEPDLNWNGMVRRGMVRGRGQTKIK